MRTLILLILFMATLPICSTFAGIPIQLTNPFYFASETDGPSVVNVAFFDLRERESCLQLTNVDSSNNNIHIQIYNVANLCNENNFFDLYTPNDTHVYNLRNILTNDGTPSGVQLPDDAFGIVVMSVVSNNIILNLEFAPIISNFRIIDDSGYEYRTNSTNFGSGNLIALSLDTAAYSTFNFNNSEGVILSDIIGISMNRSDSFSFINYEAELDNPLGVFTAVDVDIINNNEDLFSCRDVVFSCIDENSPLQEELLQLASGDLPPLMVRSSASVARLEYGINNAIPHSKGGELLCPGNNITEGIVKLTLENFGEDTIGMFGYIGLNNGNGRGSMDSMFNPRIPLIGVGVREPIRQQN